MVSLYLRIYTCISCTFTANITRIIQSLYYAPAGRYDSADKGRSIIRVTANKEYMMLCGPSLFIEMANHAIGARLA
jgi:hypothetical protein